MALLLGMQGLELHRKTEMPCQRLVLLGLLSLGLLNNKHHNNQNLIQKNLA